MCEELGLDASLDVKFVEKLGIDADNGVSIIEPIEFLRLICIGSAVTIVTSPVEWIRLYDFCFAFSFSSSICSVVSSLMIFFLFYEYFSL